MSSELIILTRTHDLLLWLLPQTEKFRKLYRHTVTFRLQNRALDFQEALYDAQAHSGKSRLSYLRKADAHLNKVRLYLLLAHRFKLLNPGQYAHVSRMVDEIGRLLGGWLKQTKEG